MSETSLAVLYLIAAVLFILSLGGLSNQETARRGNTWGIVGMTIALVGTLLHPHVESYWLISPAILAGAVIGAILAIRVVMTAMPQLVAMLHSFVGLAAVLVGIASYLSPEESVAAGAAPPSWSTRSRSGSASPLERSHSRDLSSPGGNCADPSVEAPCCCPDVTRSTSSWSRRLS